MIPAIARKKPIKNGIPSFSSWLAAPRNKWASMAVKKGATEMITPTLRSSPHKREGISSSLLLWQEQNPFPAMQYTAEQNTSSGLCWTPSAWSPSRRAELLNIIPPSETKSMVEEFYKNAGLEPKAIADAVLYAISQPENVDISDMAVRPIKES